MLVVLVALPLVFFAHSYTLTALPIIIGALVFALFAPPVSWRHGARALDAAILATLAAIALQLVPLSPATHDAVTPGAAQFVRLMIVGAGGPARPQPISLDPSATLLALMLDAALALVFWSTQRALRDGGQRWLPRAIATIGLLLAAISVVQHLNVIPGLDAVYPAIRRDLRPWGPFVNRNDFAGWMALASLLALGYLVARLEAHHHGNEGFDPDRVFDATGTRLVVALCLMSGGIMLSLSRSGLLGVGVGLAVFVAVGRGRLARGRRKGLVAIVVALLAVGALFANAGALSSRLQIAMSEGMAGRLSEWRQTWPMVVDFWPVGAGVGTYARVMALYQTSTRLITIAHADNELLQLAAEGGLLVGLPVAALLVAFVTTVVRRMRADRTRLYWIRAGAISGLAAIAAQNLVEMTLRVPATGLLAVVLAAIAVHERA